MRITIYVHGSKEQAWDAAEKAGLTGEALRRASFMGYEHRLEYDVDPATGEADLRTIDGHIIGPKEADLSTGVRQ